MVLFSFPRLFSATVFCGEVLTARLARLSLIGITSVTVQMGVLMRMVPYRVD